MASMSLECPYCGEAVSESGLRGHVMLQAGDHGRFGRLPDDFETYRDVDEWEQLRSGIATGPEEADDSLFDLIRARFG